MDKGALGIAGLVAGILGIVAGGYAYMETSKAQQKAEEALVRLNELPTEAQRARETSEAVKKAIAATKSDMEDMVAEVRAEIKKLESQTERVDILAEAKRHADESAERGSKSLVREVRALQKEMATGDQETKEHYDELKAEFEKKIEDRFEALKRLVVRWLESGVM